MMIVARARKKNDAQRLETLRGESPRSKAKRSASANRQANGSAAYGQATNTPKKARNSSQHGQKPPSWAGTTDGYEIVDASKLSNTDKLALQSVDTNTLPQRTKEMTPIPNVSPSPTSEQRDLNSFNDLFNNRTPGTTAAMANSEAYLEGAILKRRELDWEVVLNGTTSEGLPMALLKKPIWPAGENLTSLTLHQYLGIVPEESGIGYQLENNTGPLGAMDVYKKFE